MEWKAVKYFHHVFNKINIIQQYFQGTQCTQLLTSVLQT